MTITVAEICRYPVKGLNAERLARVTLSPGEGLLTALAVVQEGLEQVLGGDLLVAGAQRQALGDLDEPARALGVLVEFHVFSALLAHARLEGRHAADDAR